MVFGGEVTAGGVELGAMIGGQVRGRKMIAGDDRREVAGDQWRRGSAGSVLAMIGARWPAGGGVARRGATMPAGIGGSVSAERSALVSVAGRTLPVSVGAYCEVA